MARIMVNSTRYAAAALMLLSTAAAAVPQPVLCSSSLNQYCPPSTTCCPKYKQSSSTSFATKTIVGHSCLVSWSSAVPQGPCCDDDNDDDEYDNDEKEENSSGSGCAIGYTCAAPLDTDTSISSQLDDNDKSLIQTPHCQRDTDAISQNKPLTDKRGRPINTDYEYMPRYITCPAFTKESIGNPYGLEIPLQAASYHKKSASSDADSKEESDGYNIGQLAYFTNMGPLVAGDDVVDPSTNSRVTTAIIGIHGSGRDAGSYLCALIAAVGKKNGVSSSLLEESLMDMQDKITRMENDNAITQRRRRAQNSNRGDEGINGDNTLIIAPWFLAPADGEPESSSSSTLPFLHWVDDAPVEHTFRYGAESMPVNSEKISSYGAMDVLLETLCNTHNYPNLKRIVVAGHSAGGQFVHRWGLTSDSWCFGDSVQQQHERDNELPSIRIVAANPRSYAYLGKRRYFPVQDADISILNEDEEGETKDTLSPFSKLDFREPTGSELDDCQEYNQYCWGLQDNPNVPAPYISNNVNVLMPTSDEDNSNLFCRYANRDVVYLSGFRDTKKLGNQICNEDGYQGPSRSLRSERFYASLQVRGEEIVSSCRGVTKNEALIRGEMSKVKEGFCARHLDDDDVKVHDRIIVSNVGHDHALIFQSKEGKKGMFSVALEPSF